MVDQHCLQNTYFFRWILSPGAIEENAAKDLDLWQLARDGVRWLEERLQQEGEIQLIGAEHNDHTEIPHIHALLLIERRGRDKILDGKILDEMKAAIHQMALDQRLNREQGQLQEVAATLPVVRQGRGLQPLTRQVSTIPEIAQEPSYGTRGYICLVCKGANGLELIKKGIELCPACGRTLGRRKEEALTLSR